MCSVAQLYPNLWEAMDNSPSGSSVLGILQARILEQVAISFSRRSSWPKDQTHISCIFCNGRWMLYHQLHLGSPSETMIFCQVKEVSLCLMAFRLKYWLILGLEPATLQTGATPLVLLRLQVAESLCRSWDRLSSINWMSQFLIINYMHVCVLSHFSYVWLCVTPLTVTCQAPLSMGFSRQEYWGGLPCPPSEGFPNPGIKPASHKSPALAGSFFTTSTTWEAPINYIHLYKFIQKVLIHMNRSK